MTSRRHLLFCTGLSLLPILVKKAAAGQSAPSRYRRILFLGNSITLHSPKPDIGWKGLWGMAASDASTDYVHRLAAAIASHQGMEPEIMVRNIAPFERSYASYDFTPLLREAIPFDADLVVLAIGENAPASFSRCPQSVSPRAAVHDMMMRAWRISSLW